MLQLVSLDLQAFPVTLGKSVQHGLQHGGGDMGQAPDRNMDDPLWWAGMTIFLMGWATIFSQLYLFLRDGAWASFSIVKAFTKLPFGIAERLQIWAAAPESWFGLHSVLDFLPFSATAIVLGFLIMLSAHLS